MNIRRIKLVLHYDGTGYHGWQRQPGVPTIQDTVEQALEKLCGSAISLTGSSRTDAGVHALGQVAHFDLDSPVPTENIARALNHLLPDAIAVAEAVEVPADFDAIGSTKSKWYRYTICTAPIRPVQEIRYCWHRPAPLDVEAMAQAAARLVGTRDFKSFAAAADMRESSVRTVLQCEVRSLGFNPLTHGHAEACTPNRAGTTLPTENYQSPTIFVDVAATGFLYNMVRNIVGTLVEVGRGRWQAEEIDGILAAKDRAAAGPIAPASGLCLMQIDY